jgi:hypothetical protein
MEQWPRGHHLQDQYKEERHHLGHVSNSTRHSPTVPPMEFVTPPMEWEDVVDADHDEDAPTRFRNVTNVLGEASTPGLAIRELEAGELMFTSVEEPATFKEAEQDPCWRRAMMEEMKSIEENETWHLTDLPNGCTPIDLKWVYKVKCDEQGKIIKHKARLAAKGYVQRQGIDFNEVFAPGARMESVRLLLALAACEGWEVHHMDVKRAFLKGSLWRRCMYPSRLVSLSMAQSIRCCD